MAKIEIVKIAMTRLDGGVSIMSFVAKQFGSGEGPGWDRVPSEENINAEIIRSGVDCVSWRIVIDADIPADRYFRNAWKDDGKLAVDMPKAREIQKNVLRHARGPLLGALDIEAMRAVETNDSARLSEIAAQKQALRDVTDKPEIEAAQTPEALKAITI